MKKSLTKYLLGMLLCGLLVQSCTSSSTLHQLPIQGKIIEDRYFDPTGTFSVAVMSKAFNRIINEENNPLSNSVVVSFQNDFGMLEKVEVLKGVKPMFLEMAPLETHYTRFIEGIYNITSKQFQGTQLFEKNEFEVEGIGMVSAGILFIPEGSTLTCLETMKRNDSIRAYIVSYDGEDLVTVCVQEPFAQGPIPRDDKKANELLIKTAIDFRKTYRKQ
jgi:hypothetical protein